MLVLWLRLAHQDYAASASKPKSWAMELEMRSWQQAPRLKERESDTRLPALRA
jgi:hypothetical protein